LAIEEMLTESLQKQWLVISGGPEEPWTPARKGGTRLQSRPMAADDNAF